MLSPVDATLTRNQGYLQTDAAVPERRSRQGPDVRTFPDIQDSASEEVLSETVNCKLSTVDSIQLSGAR